MSDSRLTAEDVEWLRDEFKGNLWQVHGEFCISSGPDHCCTKEEERADAILGAFLALVEQQL